MCVCDTGVTVFILYNILWMENLQTDYRPNTSMPLICQLLKLIIMRILLPTWLPPDVMLKLSVIMSIYYMTNCFKIKIAISAETIWNCVQLSHQWNGVGVAPQVFLLTPVVCTQTWKHELLLSSMKQFHTTNILAAVLCRCLRVVSDIYI